MGKLNDILNIYDECISSTLDESTMHKDFFVATEALLSGNTELLTSIEKELHSSNISWIIQKGIARIREFAKKVELASKFEDKTDVLSELYHFVSDMNMIRAGKVTEFYDYSKGLCDTVAQIILDIEVDRVLTDKEDVRNIIKEHVEGKYDLGNNDGIGSKEGRMLKYLNNLQAYATLDVVKKGTEKLIPCILEYNDSNLSAIDKLAERIGLQENDMCTDSQKLTAISSLYNELYGTDLNVEDFSDAFYFTVGEILNGHTDYNIDKITGFK